MKITSARLQLPLLLVSMFLFHRGHAAITGQWDFKAGNLAATIGQDLSYLDSDTQTRTLLGTTTSFSIPDIGGQPTNVMQPVPRTGD